MFDDVIKGRNGGSLELLLLLLVVEAALEFVEAVVVVVKGLVLFGDEDKGEAESAVSPPCPEEVDDLGSLMEDEVTAEVKIGK